MSTTADLTVELSERSYPILFSQTDADVLLEQLRKLTHGYSKVALLVDCSLAACSPVVKHLREGLPSALCYVFPKNGETLKSLEYFGKALDWLAQERFDRKSVVVAVGGGVVGDLAGFVASSYLRGVDFIQVPTTLLSMVDSSVGGKTGINIAAGKNLVGAFYQPKAVCIHAGFLRSLPVREFSAGMAEIIKAGMLAEAALFSDLESMGRLNPEHPRLSEVIRRSCAIKAAIVKADERELAPQGGRALLNLGHTFGHAIENVAGYGEYLHGEAVAIGLVLAARLSEHLGHIKAQDIERIEAVLGRYDLPIRLRSPLPVEALMSAMYRDKKTERGKLRFVALKSLGEAITVSGVSEAWIQSSWSI